MYTENINHYTGCLLGGAVGDALGWPVEFDSQEDIQQQYGPYGITEMIPGKAGLYEITDDTQMTLFTAEGLLRGLASSHNEGNKADFSAALKRSYLCWLVTQKVERDSEDDGFEKESTGWLLTEQGLHIQRAPGNTCLSALCSMTLTGNDHSSNNSMGCGGIMRAAPAGLLAARISTRNVNDSVRLAFEIGCNSARLTHGSPSGYYPAGALAALVASVIQGMSIEEGIDLTLGILGSCSESEQTAASLQAALSLYQDSEVKPSPEVLESLGEGWFGNEALAISVYCALAAKGDFVAGVRLAVNHSGDSDSTGSITGNILGAFLGEQVIPPRWLDRLELVEITRQVGVDLHTGFERTERWSEKYPQVP